MLDATIPNLVIILRVPGCGVHHPAAMLVRGISLENRFANGLQRTVLSPVYAHPKLS